MDISHVALADDDSTYVVEKDAEVAKVQFDDTFVEEVDDNEDFTTNNP